MTARVRTVLGLVVLASLVAYGWWVTALEPFSTHATVVVLATGLVAMVVGAMRRMPAPDGGRSLASAAPWLVLVPALAAWQLMAWSRNPREENPTISSLTNAALDPELSRATAFAAWVLIAGWLARR